MWARRVDVVCGHFRIFDRGCGVIGKILIPRWKRGLTRFAVATTLIRHGGHHSPSDPDDCLGRCVQVSVGALFWAVQSPALIGLALMATVYGFTGPQLPCHPPPQTAGASFGPAEGAAPRAAVLDFVI
jgi:hypothetical protein